MSVATISFNFQNARGTLAQIPTLLDGQLYWTEDTQQLYIGTAASGNVSVTPGGGVFPSSITKVTHQWLDSYNAATGLFTQSQPNFTDLAGSIATGQIPAATITVPQLDFTGSPSSSTFARGDGSWATISAGSSVSVNGSSVSNPNFNDSTPAAPGSNTNITWQVSGSNVSAYVPSSFPPNGSAGGDLSGTYPNPTVDKVNAGSIPASKTIVGTNSSSQIVDASSATLANNTTGNAASATAALGLKTATTTVVISSATAPTSGQVLTATSSTAADWQTPSGGGGVQIATLTISAADLILSDQANPGYTPVLLVSATGTQVVILSSLAVSYTGGTNGWVGGAGTVGYTTGINFAPSGGAFPSSGNALIIDGATPITIFAPVPTVSYDGTGASVGQSFYFSVESVYNTGPILTASVTSGSGGSGYAPGDTGNIESGDDNAAYTVDTVDGGGAVLTFTITDGGQGNPISTNNATTVSSGGGDGSFAVDINTVGQPNGTTTVTVAYYLITT